MNPDDIRTPSVRRRWTRQESLIVLDLYCRIPFGRMYARNPEVVNVAQSIGRTPGAVAMKLVNFASLDPGLRERGVSGLGNVSKDDRAIWMEMNVDWNAFVAESANARRELGLFGETEISEMPEIDGAPSRVTEREGVVTQRVGQSFFRQAVLSAYNHKCCISGLAVEPLLVASHIVPWRVDEKNRVNPRNGLLLSVLHDKAFDRGLITLDDDLVVRVSQHHLPNDDAFFAETIAAYDGRPIDPPEKLSPDPLFLAYHQENVFQG